MFSKEVIREAVRIHENTNCQIVILCGISGSGKTSLAKLLESYGWVNISLDKLIWDRYGSAFHLLPFEEQKILTLNSEDQLNSRILTELKKGNRVVVDSCLCKRLKRDQIRDMIQAQGYIPTLVYLKVSKEVCQNRLMRRRGLGYDDIVIPLDRLDLFFENFEIPEIDENPIVISND